MEEFINFIIELANALKYGQWANRKKSFDGQMNHALLIEGHLALELRKKVKLQLTKLLVKGNGEPVYAYFESRKKNWYKIYIVNNEKMFYCRLRDERLEDNFSCSNFYIVL